MLSGLNFSAAPLPNFNSPVPTGFDLTGYDSATGDTTIPAGWYICLVESGTLDTTGSGDPCYRLRFAVVQSDKGDTSPAGTKVWRTLMLTDRYSFNRAKTALATLGLTTGDHLQAAYPPEGESVFCRCLVTLSNKPEYGPRNFVERFTKCDAPEGATAANPFAVSLAEFT